MQLGLWLTLHTTKLDAWFSAESPVRGARSLTKCLGGGLSTSATEWLVATGKHSWVKSVPRKGPVFHIKEKVRMNKGVGAGPERRCPGARMSHHRATSLSLAEFCWCRTGSAALPPPTDPELRTRAWAWRPRH